MRIDSDFDMFIQMNKARNHQAAIIALRLSSDDDDDPRLPILRDRLLAIGDEIYWLNKIWMDVIPEVR